MSSAAIEAVIRMMETLPETAQSKVVEHLREYFEDLQDEIRWDTAFQATQDRLGEAARRAKEQIAAGHAEPLDVDRRG
ncbi:MAG: hypothetical protein AB1646_16270 [Thermodesulfobacteriota bacterium]